ncbi:hypothetical protein BC938DRAFT_483582 [Jimgerdemannia flammicorona]|uniref:Uncharacterized protein n=1 Tax=Jimgerdemannia flammicorona TaxID=994334 RepID=A0A433QBS3_9FUNG|nr:hypothetical protein BC938DRAFT_483582 [Jimgerdemannia flammicorona]
MATSSLVSRQTLFFFFTTSLLFTLLLAFFYLVPTSNAPPHTYHSQAHSVMADENLSVLSNEFHTLRSIQGHYNGGEFNPDVDGPRGRKYQVMKVGLTVVSVRYFAALGDQLGLPNTPASDILQRLGKPDELTPTLNNGGETHVAMMPGPAIPSTEQGQQQPQPYYLVYYWRNKHDYLYFKVSI